MTEGQAPGQNLPGLNAKGAFDAVVKYVTEDEPCYLLAELDLVSAASGTRHRYQILKVVRGDKLVTAYVDLGLAGQFKANQVTIPGGYVDETTGKGYVFSTVGELREIADRLRETVAKPVEPSDLQGKFLEFLDQKDRFKTRRSSFGYGGQLVRPGYA